MTGPTVNAAELFIVVGSCLAAIVFLRKFVSKKIIALLCLFFVWSGLFGRFVSHSRVYVHEQITICATTEKNEAAIYNQIWMKGIVDDHGKLHSSEAETGEWVWYDAPNGPFYCYFPEVDERRTSATTECITISIPAGYERKIQLLANVYGGIVDITFNGSTQRIDTFAGTDALDNFLSVSIPSSSDEVLFRNKAIQLAVFACIFCSLALGSCGVIYLVCKKKRLQKLRNYRFLFEELVKRDFTLKYKRTALGILWSVLSPLLTLLVMNIVLGTFFGANIDHYMIYLFCGQLVFNCFNEASCLGMSALLENSGIFTKVNVPKYLFVFSKNIASLISFGLTFCVLLVFVIADGLAITPLFLCLVFPAACLIVFNVGIGLILSALFVFFRDMQYLWNIFTLLLMYMSALFYNVSGYPEMVQNLFLLNPVYVYILYFRTIIIDGTVPSLLLHGLALGYALIAMLIGGWIYKKYNHEFLYYV